LHINELKNYEIEHSPMMMNLKKERKREKRKNERNLFGKLLDERF
jgi:hypothetical protein